MAVNLIDVGVKVPRELNDFRLAILSIVRHLIEGKSLSQIVSDDFPLLVEAVKGADQVPVALAEELTKSVALAGLMGGELVGEFLSARQQPQIQGAKMEQDKLQKDQADQSGAVKKDDAATSADKGVKKGEVAGNVSKDKGVEPGQTTKKA